MARPELREVVRKRIKVLRVARGLTQEQLCERAAISVDAITRIESGNRIPTLPTLQKLGDALGVPMADLIDIGHPEAPKQPVPLQRMVNLLEVEDVAVQQAVLEVARAMLKALHRAASTP